MSFNPEPYAIVPAVLHWLIVFGSCLGFTLAIALVMSLLVKGLSGPRLVLQQVIGGIRETTLMSTRRTLALANLTIKDSIRRKSLLVFVVFAILFMFGGWFLSNTNERSDLQVKVYVSFVLTAISFLILPVVLMLSCWGLPDDIQSRSLHTVVTKPVRRSEVVFGRFLGYVGVGTLVLLIMGLVGYVWIERQVPPSAKDALVCRVPVYGDLRYYDREGNMTAKGINVGYVWEFRGYIEGGTKSHASYEFAGVTPASLINDQLRLESRFEAFRTYMGDVKTKLLCQYELVNPATGLRHTLDAFEVSEYGQNVTLIDRKLKVFDPTTGKEKTLDMFDDFVHDVDRVDVIDGHPFPVKKNNVLRIEVRGVDLGQYLGMARPDLFIRLPDNSFRAGFFKTLFGIWLMMVLVIVLGVTASCFAKGPVAALLTFTLILVGQGFREFLVEMVSGNMKGAGPIEAFVGILQQTNPGTRLAPGVGRSVAEFLDATLLHGLWVIGQIIPNFLHYSRLSQYVPNGFDVSWSTALLPGLAVTLAYVFPCLLIGYYSLKLRELESK